MSLLHLVGGLLEYLGTVMIAFTALRVHHRVLKEHRVDAEVEKIMKREQRIGLFGVAILTIGFILSQIADLGV